MPRTLNFPVLTLAACLTLSRVCFADATLPAADIPDGADPAQLKRYEGALIVSQDTLSYAELKIPLSPLKPSPLEGERDAQNNRLYVPERAALAEGALTRLVYVLPEQRSPLEIVRNYQDEVAAADGQIEYECKRDGCGGDSHRAADGGGGKTSLTQYFFYDTDIKDKPHSNGACAVTSRIDDQHFFAAQLPQSGASAWLTVQAYRLNAGPYCKALNGRTIAIVQWLEPKPRAQKMVAVKADDMAKAMDQQGSIALYGIYFDTAQAALKPESTPTLQEIAALLKQAPKLAVLVVGHTDNQGSHEYNLELSARRANAVKQALIAQHGIEGRRLAAAGAGMMAPVASNATEEGRARNRRVALVPLR